MGFLLNLIPAPYRWVVDGVLLLAVIAGGYFGYEHWANVKRNEGAEPYIAAIVRQKAEASALLATLTEANTRTEKRLQDFANDRNENDQVNEGAISVLADKLHAARLRDPAASGCGGPSPGGQVAASSGAGGKDSTEAGGLLSDRTSEFLRSQARLADDINAAYQSCRADAYEVRK